METPSLLEADGEFRVVQPLRIPDREQEKVVRSLL
jgi:hypothetical protein